MRQFMIVTAVLFIAGAGLATIDTDPDQIGVYFDTAADHPCVSPGAFVPFWAYVIVTRPTSSEVRGIEFSLCAEFVGGTEVSLVKLNEVWTAGLVAPPVEVDWCTEGVVQGWPSPLVPLNEMVVIVGRQFMLTTAMSVNFFLGPVPIQSIDDGLPAYVGEAGVIMPLGVSSGDVGLPVASVNGCEAVQAKTSSFGAVKSLFR
jgi:hypothetical protein